MRKTLLLLLLGAGWLAPTASAQPSSNYIPGQLVVQTRLGANPAAVSRALAVNGASLKRQIPQIKVQVLRVPAQAADAISQALRRTGHFTFVERDVAYRGTATPNDPSFA